MRLLLFFFVFLPISLFCQNKEDIYLNVNDFKNKGDTILLGISIFNNGLNPVTCYKINTIDICRSVLKIKAQDDFGNIYEVFPCKTIIDSELIYLDCNNTVKLFPNEGFVKFMKFAVKDFTPYLTKGHYELFVEVNYSVCTFETKLQNVLKTDLLSKKYSFYID